MAVTLMLADSEAEGLKEGVSEGEGVPLTVPHSDTVGVTLGQVLGDGDTETVTLLDKHGVTVLERLLLALTDPLPLRDRELLKEELKVVPVVRVMPLLAVAKCGVIDPLVDPLPVNEVELDRAGLRLPLEEGLEDRDGDRLPVMEGDPEEE